MPNPRLQTRLALGLCGLMVILAAVAFFAGSHKAAAIIASQASMVMFLTYAAAKRGWTRRA